MLEFMSGYCIQWWTKTEYMLFSKSTHPFLFKNIYSTAKYKVEKFVHDGDCLTVSEFIEKAGLVTKTQ